MLCLQSVDDRWQRRDGAGSVASAIMQEHDRPFLNLPGNSVGDRLRNWLRPVQRIDVPCNRMLAEIVRQLVATDPNARPVPRSIGRTEEVRDTASDALDHRRTPEYLCLRAERADVTQILVRVGVVPNDVSVTHFVANERLVLLGGLSNDEEGRRNVLAAQDGENLRRPLRIWSVIERERHNAAGANVPDRSEQMRLREGAGRGLPGGRR